MKSKPWYYIFTKKHDIFTMVDGLAIKQDTTFHPINCLNFMWSAIFSSSIYKSPDQRGVAVRDYRNSQWSIPLREYDIFPSRKCDILLSQYDICPKGHVIVKNVSQIIAKRFLFLHIFEENISQAKPISYGISRISPICNANWFHCWLVISL